MSLFVCDKCGVIENTASSNYHVRRIEASDAGKLPPRALCSLCDPEIGKWHGIFPRVTWTVEAGGVVLNR